MLLLPRTTAACLAIVTMLAMTIPASGLAQSPPVIEVADVETLYAVVNDPGNAGVDVKLAAGRYVLTTLDPNDIARPNGGRLELQPHMSLFGEAGHPEEVVIDASALNAPNNPVRIGRGQQAIESLTIVGKATSGAGIVTDLVGGPTTWLRIAHVIATGSQRGIDVRNQGAAAVGRTIVIELDDNELVENLWGNGQGVRLVNTGANGASIIALLRRNRSHGNLAGVLAANLASSGASIVIDSHDDQFENNRIGCVILGGVTQNSADVANDNSVTITMHAGRFINNVGLYPPNDFTGGLAVVGGQTSPVGSASRNKVYVSLWGTKFDGQIADVSAWGANTNGVSLAGTHSLVAIDLHGVSGEAITSETASNPPEPAGTNVVTITTK